MTSNIISLALLARQQHKKKPLGCIPEWERDCGYVRVSEPLAGDVRGAQAKCAM